MSAKVKKIYLAGGKGDWRKTVAQALLPRPKGVELIDPFTQSNQNSISDFTHDDLLHVRECDGIFAYIDYHVYTGSALEFGYAYALGKPIIYVCALPRIDSMMVGVAKAAFTDLDAGIQFMKERWL